MNKNVMKIAIEAVKVLAGAVAGAIGGYFLGKHVAEKKAGKVPQIEVEEPDEEESEPAPPSENMAELCDLTLPYVPDYGAKTVEESLAETQSPDEDIPEPEEVEFDREKFLQEKMNEDLRQKHRKTKPYEISAEEFDEDNGFEKKFYNLYDGDGAITDEHDTFMENWRTVVGVDGPSHLEVDEEVSVVHIRNEAMRTDIELTRVDGRFFEEGEDS